MSESGALYTLLIAVPVILAAISVHEMMHALTSLWLGDDTAQRDGRISLNPLRHIDPVLTVALPALLVILGLPPFGAAKPVMINMHRVKWQEFGGAIIAMAGPLSNLIMAAGGALIVRLLDPAQASQLVVDVLGWFIIINIGFFVFNSIPWPPLDGSRLLYAFAPPPLQRFMDSLEQQGMLGIFALILLITYTPAGQVLVNINRALTRGLL